MLKKDKLSSHKKIIYESFIEAFWSNTYAGVYKNFEADVYNALEQRSERVRKYETLKIIQ